MKKLFVCLLGLMLIVFSLFGANAPRLFIPWTAPHGTGGIVVTTNPAAETFTIDGGNFVLKPVPPPDPSLSALFGLGESNRIPLWTGSNTLGNSQFIQRGTQTWLTNESSGTEAVLRTMRTGDPLSQLVVGSTSFGGLVHSSGTLALSTIANSTMSFAEGVNQLVWVGKHFKPGVSNDIVGGDWDKPYADWFSRRFTLLSADGTTNVLTGTNGTLYLNGVPVVGGPWTDDGATTYLDAGNTNAFRISNLTGDTSIGTNANSLLTLSASPSYQSVAMNWTDGTNTQAAFIQLQDTNVSPVSSFEVDYGLTPLTELFPFVPDGANSIAYTFDTANVLGSAGALLTAFRHNGTNVATISPNGDLQVFPNTLVDWGGHFASDALIAIHDVALGDTNWVQLWLESYGSTGNTLGFVDLHTDTNSSVIRLESVDNDSGNGTRDIFLVSSNGTSYFQMTSNVVSTVFIDGSAGTLSLSGTSNLIGMNVSGQLTVDGVPVGGGSSPWATATAPDVEGGTVFSTYSLNNITNNVISYAVSFETNGWGQAASIITLGYNAAPALDIATNTTFDIFIAGDYAGKGAIFSNLVYNVTIVGPNAGQDAVFDGSGGITMLGNGAGGNGGGPGAVFTNTSLVTMVGNQAGGSSVMSGANSIGLFGDAAGIGSAFYNSTAVDLWSASSAGGAIFDTVHAAIIWGYEAGLNARLTNSEYLVAFGPGSGKNLSGSYTNVILVGDESTAPSGTHDAFVFGPNMKPFLADTNGGGGFVKLYASTNSGSAVLYTEGSPPTATVPIGNDGKYDLASGITVGGTNALTENIVLGLVTLTVRNGLIISHSP